ncbi:MAG TPA: SPOR domain-containing protein [Methylomirabilota bacterium]|nr:SPOR domain-containing protein [Methylomirabilota bacterium]
MAGAKKGGSGDMVLESRHLVGLFLLLTVIFGVVFTLGYLLGRSQYDTQLRAATAHAQESAGGPADRAAPPEKSPPAPQGSDWSFYHSADPKPANDHLVPAPGPAPAASSTSTPAPAKPPKPAASAPAAQPKATPPAAPAPKTTPSIPKGAIVLQVAALVKESDALALAQVLQEKKFPAFVLSPSADKYYRVQVGPYADAAAAAVARDKLEAAGFKSIVKR